LPAIYLASGVGNGIVSAAVLAVGEVDVPAGSCHRGEPFATSSRPLRAQISTINAIPATGRGVAC
jgi:hypothetical protein